MATQEQTDQVSALADQAQQALKAKTNQLREEYQAAHLAAVAEARNSLEAQVKAIAGDTPYVVWSGPTPLVLPWVQAHIYDEESMMCSVENFYEGKW